jgi:PAS domain S-box-containing protein
LENEVRAVRTAEKGAKRFSLSAQQLLALLCIALLTPVVAFIAFSLNQYTENRRAAQTSRLVEYAASLASNSDRELWSLVTTANALALSPSLQKGDFASFHGEASQLVRVANAHVLLIDRNLQILLHTRTPYGTPLPKTSAPEAVSKAFRDNRPQISNVFFGKVSSRLVFDAFVPVEVGGQPRYVLTLTSEPQRFTDLLKAQGLPKGWGVALFDAEEQLVASNLDTPPPWASAFGASAAAGEVMLAGEGEGQSYAAVQELKRAPWRVVVWAPRELLLAPTKDIWSTLLWAGLIAMALAALLAYLFSLPFTKLIAATRDKAEGMGSGRTLPPIRSLLAEGRLIDESLARADADILSRQRQAQAGQALLDTLLANVPEGISIAGGPDLRIIANSAKALELTGRSPDALQVAAEDEAKAFGLRRLDGTEPEPERLPLFRASRHGEVINAEKYLILRPDGRRITVEVSVNPYFDGQGNIVGAVSCWRDVTEQHRAMQQLTESERRLRLALSVGDMAIVDLDARPGGRAHVINSEAIFGIELNGLGVEAANKRFSAAVHEADRARVVATQAKTAQALGSYDDEFRVVKPSGEVLWIEVRGECLPLEDGSPGRLVASNMNITARKTLEQQLRLISRELTHRVKNVLTVVQGILSQTARSTHDNEALVANVSARLQGLAASHDLLVNSNWSGTQLGNLVAAQLAAFGGVGGKRILAQGPEVLLKVDVMQNLGMALHELATNAVKYGALSAPDGRIRIDWSVADGRLSLAWTESGGPPVAKPQRQGFGHVVMVRSLERVLYGKVEIKFPKSGVTWTVDAPLEAVVFSDERHASLPEAQRT